MAKYIKELTEQQNAEMQPYAQKWIDECLRPGTTEEDWIRAEEGIRESYIAAGLKPPGVIVRTTSPLACVLAGPIAAMFVEQKNNVHDAVRDAVDGTVRGAVNGAVRGAVYGAVDGAVRGAVRGAVYGAVRGAVDGAVDGAVRGAVRGAVGDAWHKYNGGSLWGGWAAWRIFFVDICGLKLDPKIMDLVETWRKLSTGAGWWWPHKEFCIVAPRHEEIHRDAEGRLHCEDDPALRYPDGWSIYVWHGTRIPADWIEDKKNLNPEIALNWENVEQRRCAAEIIGWDRILAQLPIESIDKDVDPEIGELLQVDLPDAPRQQFLKVLCGTGRTFVLPCVHNDFKTALEANAASWGENGVDPKLLRNREWRT